MDSKLKLLTISCVCLLGVLIFFVVFYVNQDELSSKRKNTVSVEDTVPDAAQTDPAGSGRETFEGTQLGNDLSGFLNDDSFFDKKKTKYEEYLEQKNTLSLILTSIEKDLRIKVVNFDGNLVAGELFKVDVEGEGTYADMDKDGIIYIPKLSAGDYLVSLEEMDGYTVPRNPARVHVKEQVEYVAIEDISMLIKTEDEIDPSRDDTQALDLSEDTDKTEIRKLRSISEDVVAGIDVSKWNGKIDWEKVKNAGVKFVIIRCGYRGLSSGSLVVDPYFEENMQGAQDAGLDVGVYFYTQAVNEVEAVEEASMVLTLLKNQYITYPVFFDTEGAGGKGRASSLDPELRTKICLAFCDTIQSGGYQPGVYASRNWFNHSLDASRLEHNKIWLAEYRSAPTYEGYYDMWQYTSKGQIDGIEGNVDLNISYMKLYEEEEAEEKEN